MHSRFADGASGSMKPSLMLPFAAALPGLFRRLDAGLRVALGDGLAKLRGRVG